MFFWPFVDIGNHGDQISNSPDELLVANQTEEHIPRGMGRGKGSTEQCAVFKSQEIIPLWPECTNCVGLSLLGNYS